MPHNSQSPLMLRLNERFVNPKLLPEHYLAESVSEGGETLAQRARAQEIVLNGPESEHIDKWPKDQQDDVRGCLLVAIQDGLPVSFAWERAPATKTMIVCFGTKVGITFRSPRDYPPYTQA